jgi:hypothetical protein
MFLTFTKNDWNERLLSDISIEGVPLSGGYAAQCAGDIQGKEGRIQVLAGLAPSSQTVGSNIRLIHEQAKCSS